MMKEDWVECTLGDFIQHRGKSLNPKNHLNEVLELYSVPNHTIKKPEIKLGKEIGSSKQVVGNNWVLLSRINPHLNRSWVIKSDSDLIKIASSEWVKFPPNVALNPEFIGYFLTKTELKNYMCLNVSGVGGSLTRTNKNAINVFNFSLPPLVEQQAIVRKIETLFSSLDSGIADLKKAQEQLKIYRQAVLKKAFEGDNFSSKSIIEVVEKVQIGPFGSQLHKSDYIISGIPLINPMHIQEGKLKPNPYYTISKRKRDSLPNYILKEGDVIMGRRGEMGRSALIAKNEAGWLCGTGCLYLRPNLFLISPKYLNKYIQSPIVKTLLSGSATGTTMMNLNKKIISTLPIPIPSLEIQHQIVQEIESRLSVCDKVEKDITDSLEKAQALRQSILKKAFEGKLLSPAELAACRAHPDYEPASVLLEKIKKEKLGNLTTVRTARKKTLAPQKISTDIQAGVIAKIIKLHEEYPEYLENLSHVKCEKLSHLAEYHIHIPLGRNPVKDAAGPNDYPHLKKVEKRAKMTGYFSINKIKGKLGYSYKSGKNISKAISGLESKITEDQVRQLDNLIEMFLKFDIKSSEIVATLYAGWNNLLLDGKTPTDDEIVYESRENWSKRKLSIKKERFYKALNWMRKEEIALVPSGYGLPVTKRIK